MRNTPWWLPLLLLSGSAVAQELPELPAVAEHAGGVDVFALDSQLEKFVVSSTKVEQRGAATPAVITVVTSDEIQARGYSSLADVLREVPGFYDVYDGVTHNIGVRGINGGVRASGNVLKLMIDGQPVDYRPTTGNFFGEELIPLDVIERVEIIRGPASALYGANAFLGVVNVITRSGEKINGAHLIGQGAINRSNPGGGGGAVVGARSGGVDVMLGGTYLYLDRSGLVLPKSSPNIGGREHPEMRSPSRDDKAQPKSLFGKLSIDAAWGRLTLMATIQNLESGGEFQDFTVLSHDTRIAMLNQNYVGTYQLNAGSRFSLTASGHYFNSAPGGREKLDILRTDYRPLRSQGADGWGLSLESRIKAHDRFTILAGADFVQENHLLQSFDQLQLVDQSATVPAGTVIPGNGHGLHKTFDNVGAYVQGVFAYKDWSAVAGLRIDYHNIYGVNFSPRAGVVYAPLRRPLSIKLLYGSSFKAPSAEQLYTQPIQQQDLLGNPALRAQTAHTVELSGGYGLPRNIGEISLNLFATDVIGRVEFVKQGVFLQAQNIANEWVVGGELDSRFKVIKPIKLRFTASVARTVSRSTMAADAQPSLNQLYPTYQFHLLGDYFFPWWALRFGVEVAYIGPRNSSQSNSVINGTPYELPGYLYTAATLSTSGRKIIPNRETNIALRVSNFVNWIWTEPGFNGVDVPAQGVTGMLTLIQQL